MVNDSPPDKLTLRIEMVCLIREIGRKPFSLIDRILNLEPGTARETYEKHNESYQSWMKKHANNALERWFRDQVTILQYLSTAMPEAIKVSRDTLFDPEAKRAEKERAAAAIERWTKIFLSAKDSESIRDLIPKQLLEAFDEAEEMGGILQKTLGSALDLDDEEEPS